MSGPDCIMHVRSYGIRRADMFNRFFAFVNWKKNRPFIVNLLALALGVVMLPVFLAGFVFLAFVAAIFGLALKA